MNRCNEAGVELIKGAESYLKKLKNGDCQAYLDTLAGKRFWSPGYKGLWTIGWGNTGKDITEGTVWTREHAEQRFRAMVANHERLVSKAVTVPLTDNQFSALVSLSYNWADFAGSTLVKKLNKGDYAGAAECFAAINKAGGKVYNGLVTRRAAERKLFLSDAPSTFWKPAIEVTDKVTAPVVTKEATKAVVAKSRTLNGIAWLRNFFTVAMASVASLFSLETLGVIQGFLKDNSGYFLVGTLVMFAIWNGYTKYLESAAVASHEAGEWEIKK